MMMNRCFSLQFPILLLLSVVVLILQNSSCIDAYLIRSTMHPNLNQFAEAQLGKLMDIRFVIQGSSKAQEASSKLALQGPMVRFMDQVADKIMKNVMPASSHYRHLSSGAKSLDIVKEGFVVDMNGRKTIPFQNGSWEMTWKDGQRYGSIVCGFDLPEAVSRNQISLPACHVFAQFLVWTKEGLLEDQAFRRLMEDRIRSCEEHKQVARVKYEETNNPVAKARHMLDLYQAMEDSYYIPRCEHIPLRDGEVIELDNGLVLAKKGTVWTTSRNQSRKTFLRTRPTRLGHASINLFKDTASPGTIAI